MAKQKLTEIEKIIKTLPLPKINYDEGQKQVSYSQFSTYLKCPYQWYLKYGLKNYDDKNNVFTIFGTAIHHALQHYIKTMYEISGAEADREDLLQIFEDKYIEEYKKAKEKQIQHFSTAQELREFNEDGKHILEWFKRHRAEYFTTRNVRLLGIELPLIMEVGKDIFFKGLLDIVLYDIDLDKIYIIDFKTSTRGWGDKEKKDEIKTSQIVLYKDYFAKQYDFDIDKIEVEFIILKRKIWEQSEFPQKRIQSFKPASGKNTRKKIATKFETFLKECYNEEGKAILDKEYHKNTDSCKYCFFSDKPELCNKKNIDSSITIINSVTE